jgi:hypothetical protein
MDGVERLRDLLLVVRRLLVVLLVVIGFDQPANRAGIILIFCCASCLPVVVN